MKQTSALPSRDSFKAERVRSVWAGKKQVIAGICDKRSDKKDKGMLQGIRENRGGGWGAGRRAGTLPRGGI